MNWRPNTISDVNSFITWDDRKLVLGRLQSIEWFQILFSESSWCQDLWIRMSMPHFAWMPGWEYLDMKRNSVNALKSTLWHPNWTLGILHSPKIATRILWWVENELIFKIRSPSILRRLFPHFHLFFFFLAFLQKATLTCGTTTATYYASVFRESCEILADVCEELGQRALIGKVCMNMGSPEERPQDQILENTPECLIMTEQFVRNILDRKVRKGQIESRGSGQEWESNGVISNCLEQITATSHNPQVCAGLYRRTSPRPWTNCQETWDSHSGNFETIKTSDNWMKN